MTDNTLTTKQEEGGKLLGCPFCGGSANVLENQHGHFEGQCFSCFTSTDGFALREQAAAAWNTRAPVTPPHNEDGLRKALERIATGDEPRPVGKPWNTDRTYSKHDRCIHDVWMYETCGQCIAEFARQALGDIPSG